MQIRLISLKAQHFKGFDDYSLFLNGGDADIYGANATGKTTIFDAYSWLLFGIDSVNTPNFSPKPTDADGKQVHGLETSVVAEFSASNGKLIKLARIMSEDWIKPRGSAERTFNGNTYSFFINDVPTTKTEYDSYVKSIVAQDVFKMITNPSAFNELDWKKRRQMLLDISGTNVDAELLVEPQYERIKLAMDERGLSLDELRTATTAQRKKINDALERIPIQIAEVQRMDIGVSDSEIEQAQKQRESLLAEIAGIDRQLTDMSAMMLVQEQTIRTISNAKTECMAIERQMDAEAGRAKVDAQAELLRLTQSNKMLVQQIERLKDGFKQREQWKSEYTARADALRAEWMEINKTQFVQPDGADTCSHCGQTIPAEDAQKIIGSAKARWQADKAERLDDITKRGKEAKARADEMGQSINADMTSIEETERTIANNNAQIDKLRPVADSEQPKPDYMTNIRYAALMRQYTEQERCLNSENTDVGRSTRLTAERRSKQDQLAKCDEVLARQTQHERNQQRIAELTDDLRAQGELMADTEQLLILIEKFVTDRCKLLEDSINSMFETVRWKLFDVQINMGIKDTCECMIPGDAPGSSLVPYATANRAAKVNAGLEIIDVLSRFYDVAVPVMIDNAESVNRLRRIGAQRIALYVSADATMRLESTNNEEVA